MEEFISHISKFISLVVLVVGTWWGITKFFKKDELFPRIQFDVDADFVGFQNGKHLVQVQANIDNKGVVPIRISDFDFTLRGINEDDEITEGTDIINGQIDVPHILKRGSWKHKRWNYTFVYPGVKNKYTYLAAIPEGVSYMLLHGKFIYENDEDFHTASRLFKVPKNDIP